MMKPLTILGHVDAKRRLSAQVPSSVPPGDVELTLKPLHDEQDDAAMAWAGGIAREWGADLADTGQDIYTLADGEPVDVCR